MLCVVQVTRIERCATACFLASASLDFTVQIWAPESSAGAAWQCAAVLEGHAGRVTDLHFTPDASHLITGKLQASLLPCVKHTIMMNNGTQH